MRNGETVSGTWLERCTQSCRQWKDGTLWNTFTLSFRTTPKLGSIWLARMFIIMANYCEHWSSMTIKDEERQSKWKQRWESGMIWAEGDEKGVKGGKGSNYLSASPPFFPPNVKSGERGRRKWNESEIDRETEPSDLYKGERTRVQRCLLLDWFRLLSCRALAIWEESFDENNT